MPAVRRALACLPTFLVAALPALTPAGGATVAVATTADGAGHYSADAPEGDYDVRVTAAIDGCSWQARVDDVTVDGRPLDVLLRLPRRPPAGPAHRAGGSPTLSSGRGPLRPPRPSPLAP